MNKNNKIIKKDPFFDYLDKKISSEYLNKQESVKEKQVFKTNVEDSGIKFSRDAPKTEIKRLNK